MSHFDTSYFASGDRLENLGGERMAVAFAIDTSGSITPEQLGWMQDNLNDFSRQVCENALAAKCVDVCVFTFADTVQEIMPWCSVRDMPQVILERGCMTDLNGGALSGAKALREHSALYANLGLVEKKPYLIIMTDGCDTVTGSVEEAASYIVPREHDGKLKTFFLGYGSYDRAAAARLTEGNGSRVFEVKDGRYRFDEFFDFVANSVKAASVSAPGERLHVETSIGQEGSSTQVVLLDSFLNS